MVNHQNLWSELSTTFEQDLPVTSQLLDLLQAERQALEARDYESFQQIIAQKQALLGVLEAHAATRQALITAAGFSDEHSILSAADQQAPVVAKTWRRLGEQWRQCQELNEINERIAKRTRLVVSQILDLLRGQNAGQRLYNRQGSPDSASGGRSITSA